MNISDQQVEETAASELRKVEVGEETKECPVCIILEEINPEESWVDMKLRTDPDFRKNAELEMQSELKEYECPEGHTFYDWELWGE